MVCCAYSGIIGKEAEGVVIGDLFCKTNNILLELQWQMVSTGWLLIPYINPP
jgi:hypothetical protein